MMLPLAAFFTGGVGKVTLSGEGVTAGPGASPQTATIRIDADGNVYEIVNAIPTQVDVGTDWIRPASLAPGPYEVRFTNLLGSITSSTAAEDTWHALSGGDFDVSKTVNAGEGTATFAIEIRVGSSGGTVASASYSLNCSVI